MNLTLSKKGDQSRSNIGIREYFTPAQYFDPKKQIIYRKNSDYKNIPHQKKFQATVKHKPCFIDKQVQPYLGNPSPDKYKTITNREGFFENDPKTQPIFKKKSKSVDLMKTSGQKLKRNTIFDDIEKYEAKHKFPGVGQFDLTKDPFKKTIINIKPKTIPVKFNNLDDIKYVSSSIPGPGFYNPHKSVPHLKPVETDMKFYKAKHEEIQAKRAKYLATKNGPTTYRPILNDTFDRIAKDKKKQKSRWSHGHIDIRKGLRSFYKSPSPSDHSMLNQWVPNKKEQRQSRLGKVKLLDRTTRSTKSLSVYH